MRVRRALILVSLLLVVVPARPAGAQTIVGDPVTRPLVAEAIGALSPLLIGVEVVGSGYPAAYDAWAEAGEQLELADGQRISGEQRAGELAVVEQQLAEALEMAKRRANETVAISDAARAQVVDMAVGSFMINDAASRPHTGTDPDEEQEDQRLLLMSDAVGATMVEEYEEAERVAQQAIDAVGDAQVRFDRVVAEHQAARMAHADADRRSEGWAGARVQRQAVLPTLAPATRVAGVGLRTVVVDAYARASRNPAVTCSLPWNVLAGIGRVETRHGEHGGSAPDLAGQVAPRIVGIPLDGNNDTMEIRDTDGGAHDGDTVFDRAVGPMQFIPSTWSRHGVDGNADGATDPNNLYDAAASAAAYLCRSMPADGDLRRAILTYNRDNAYVDAVLDHADAYGIVRLPVPAA